MTRCAFLLIFSICIAPLGVLSAGIANAGEGRAKASGELSVNLDEFVREAIDEGLLTPSGDKESTTSRSGEAQARDEAPKSAAVALSEDVIDCDGPYPLDFSEYREFDRYQQVFSYRDKTDKTGDEQEKGDFNLAEAYISLGLYSEATLAIRKAEGARATAYRKVALLLEGVGRPDIGYFRKLSTCYEDAGFWLAVALMADDQDEGADRFEANLDRFRALPFQMRADVAALAIPQLDKRGEKILQVKLMADFSDREIAETSQLRFAKAIVDLGNHIPDSDKRLRAFLNEPQFQERALATLMRRGQPLNDLHEEILLAELMKKFGRTGDDKALATSLQFALEELSGSSHYGPIIELASMPALQDEKAQGEIRRHFIDGLQRDLHSDNSLRNLAALNALAAGEGILAEAPERAKLYHMAASMSVRFGLVSVAREMVDRAGRDDAVITELTRLEFMRRDYHSVYAWARSYPDIAPVNLLAARGAIRQGDLTSFEEFESGLEFTPETILILMEEDASAGHWIVSDDIYQQALTFQDNVQSQRAERVFSMRRAAKAIETAPPKASIASVRSLLSGQETDSRQVMGGAR